PVIDTVCYTCALVHHQRTHIKRGGRWRCSPRTRERSLPPMQETRSFGSWLKLARRRRDLTQEALAEQVGCATPTLSKIEQGTRRRSRELAELLPDALALPPAERGAMLRLARQATTTDAPALPVESGAEPPSLPTARSTGRIRLPMPIAPLIGREAERA